MLREHADKANRIGIDGFEGNVEMVKEWPRIPKICDYH